MKCEVTLSNTKDLRRSSVSSLSTDARDEKLRVLSEISFCVCVLWCCCSPLWRRGVGLIFVSLSKQRNGTKSRDAEMQQQSVSQQLLWKSQIWLSLNTEDMDTMERLGPLDVVWYHSNKLSNISLIAAGPQVSLDNNYTIRHGVRGGRPLIGWLSPSWPLIGRGHCPVNVTAGHTAVSAPASVPNTRLFSGQCTMRRLGEKYIYIYFTMTLPHNLAHKNIHILAAAFLILSNKTINAMISTFQM